ncbi:tRNA 2-selenouridine(34) synthase MnmH [Comamonas flocculans]|uniref:tRNA 2-selenouridine(34) synthase MnmH n=1 Tax=Comamonas flocculans TaxID=2597701 RepID=A0A5B8RWI3_9BURK|nr:tRNA 2-selenouridine(34) synthase MnmH [Comamonas flocculans]QEA13443.1 tRNA 2-selenouridine(34) synthase MnmH [Comamonas flocculans]
MSHPCPIRPADIGRFDALIDARSPAEFAEDHLPGAINCPVLDDAERATVGTLYVQQGAFEARRVGGAMVAAHLAEHLRGAFAEQPAGWRPLVYCWRGGMRSGAMVQWMRLVGWKAEQLAGGYKAFRRHVIDGLQAGAAQLQIRAVVGATGSAKTRILHALAARGAQVLDLEGLARHKGSLLGGLPGVEQPSQKHFETRIWHALQAMDLAQPVYVEGESARIGRLSVPPALVQRLRQAPCIEIDAPLDERLRYLLRDYAYLGDEPEELAERLAMLTEMHGHKTVQRWQAWAHGRELAPLFGELIARHYDPHYGRSQQRNFARWDARQRIAAGDLSDAGIAALAETLLGQARAAA